MLVALQEGERIEARIAPRDGAFACPNCRRDMVLKRGRLRIAHFAHRPPVDCDWASGETEAHLQAKARLRDALAARGLRAELEVEVPSLGGDRRADLLVRSPRGRGVAIELQHTPITVEEVARRSAAYSAAGIAPLWVAFLRPGVLHDAVLEPPEGGDRFVRRYPARAWEFWAQSFHLGSLWYYDPEGAALWQGRLGAHEIHARPACWYDRGGREHRVPAQRRLSRRWRELTLWGPHAPERLMIRLRTRPARTIAGYALAAGAVASFAA